jgi:hypothetical protein
MPLESSLSIAIFLHLMWAMTMPTTNMMRNPLGKCCMCSHQAYGIGFHVHVVKHLNGLALIEVRNASFGTKG